MIYVVDIDGTICHTPNVAGVNRYDLSEPMASRIDHINSLYRDGHTVVYWTARGGSTGKDWTEVTTRQLRDWGCSYTELKMKKPSYDVWIDDKAHFADTYFKDI